MATVTARLTPYVESSTRFLTNATSRRNFQTLRILTLSVCYGLLFGFAKLALEVEVEICLFVILVHDLFPLWAVLEDFCDELYVADSDQIVNKTYKGPIDKWIKRRGWLYFLLLLHRRRCFECKLIRHRCLQIVLIEDHQDECGCHHVAAICIKSDSVQNSLL